MGTLIYSAIASLDGYVADADGRFDWAEPSDEVHAAVNDLTRPIGTALYGRRLYEVLVAWEHPEEFVGDSAVMRDYAELWAATDKVVYSTTLTTPASARTRIEPTFDPEAVRAMKAADDRPLAVGGAHLAAQALAAGLVDEVHLFLVPEVVGGGTPVFPGPIRVSLDLIAQRRFADGTVHLHHRVRS